MYTSHLPEVIGLFSLPVAFRSLVDEIPLGVVVLDVERTVIFLNRALEALTGFSREEARGIPCYHVLRNRICVQGCPALNLNAEAEPPCVESDLINRARQKIPVRITMAPLKDIESELVGFLETVEDMRPLRRLEGKTGQAYSFGPLIGKSPQIEKIFQILPVLAQSDSSVLITGETGTGKDLVAETIHQASSRAKGPFIKLNCGALPETLLESELFGHQKGAFTGAVENKPGRFRLAHHGTLYLTEIGDLPPSLQVKLLTFLDDRVIYPLGSTRGFQADVRIVAATHRNLEQMVGDGGFREDLLFRLNVVRLHLPPLRERDDDVRLLIDHFLNTFATQFKKDIGGFSSKALRILSDYHYPGNVRELRNIIEYAVNISQGGLIHPKHLPTYLTEKGLELQERGVGENWASISVQPGVEDLRRKWETETWSSTEKKMIMEALIKARGRRTKAAALLGWGRSTLWRKMKEYGISS
ncbi:MAG: sigma 54-interacting transcriptional regulator [Pseudomonadota bacterium]